MATRRYLGNQATDQAKKRRDLEPLSTAKTSTQWLGWFEAASSSNFLQLGVAFLSLLTIGSTFSTILPQIFSVYTFSEASAAASQRLPYFANKSNSLNLYFVKVGWAWTILAFTSFLLLHPLTGPPQALVFTRLRVQALLRMCLMTLWWITVSRWSFGPALMDRFFLLTGGKCHELTSTPAPTQVVAVQGLLTENACKVAGGTWRGGHDMSGHVFLLVLSSAMLLLESRPALPIGKSEELPHSMDKGPSISWRKLSSRGWRLELLPVIIVISVDLWMLLTTAIFFHTFSEKVRIMSLRVDLAN